MTGLVCTVHTTIEWSVRAWRRALVEPSEAALDMRFSSANSAPPRFTYENAMFSEFELV